jgi:hypothetical protein
MSDDVIIKNEVMNDGMTLHLYFSQMFGEYVAYGFSAYVACGQCPSIDSRPFLSYSAHFQMPKVRVDGRSLKVLKRKLAVLVDEAGYMRLHDSEPIDEDEYEEWANMLRG